jgi:hypothetical protein
MFDTKKIDSPVTQATSLNDLEKLTVDQLIDYRQRIEALLPVVADDVDHEIIMMVGTAPDLQAAIKARNARIKASGTLRRRADG